jgi:tetratricopeptide (TPR) repeat protein
MSAGARQSASSNLDKKGENMSNLDQRFVYGSNDLAWYLPFTPQNDFFIGLPQKSGALLKLSQKQIELQQKTLTELSSSYPDYHDALSEISRQVERLGYDVEHDLGNIENAITRLEKSLGLNLAEIRLVLGQINDNLAELSYLTKYKRRAEAGELVLDAVKAMSHGYFDEAEKRLRKAIDKKFSCFPAHTNLGFVYLHQRRGLMAIKHFKTAVDFASDWAPGEIMVQIGALETLARAYYALKRYDEAFGAATDAQRLRESHGPQSPESEYRCSIYIILDRYSRSSDDLEEVLKEHLFEIVKICAEHPAYFAIALTDKDLEPFRPQLLNALERMTQAARERAKQKFQEIFPRSPQSVVESAAREHIAEYSLQKTPQEMMQKLPENTRLALEKFQSAYTRIWELINHPDYSSVREALGRLLALQGDTSSVITFKIDRKWLQKTAEVNNEKS